MRSIGQITNANWWKKHLDHPFNHKHSQLPLGAINGPTSLNKGIFLPLDKELSLRLLFSVLNYTIIGDAD